MKHIKIPVWTFEEADEKLQQKILEKHWEINVDYDWWEFTYEEWKEKLEKLGYPDAVINFSGFYSQGDGASFTSGIDSTVLVDRMFDNAEKELAKGCTFYGSVIRTSYQYSHWNTVKVSFTDIDFPEEIYSLEDEAQDSEEKYKEWKEITDKIWQLQDQLQNAVTEEVHDLSRQIYEDLESEYESLTSKEAIEETLLSNQYLFDANGDIVGSLGDEENG